VSIQKLKDCYISVVGIGVLAALVLGIARGWLQDNVNENLYTRVQALERRFDISEMNDNTITITPSNEDVVIRGCTFGESLADKMQATQDYLDLLEELDAAQKRPGRIEKLKNNLAEFYSLPEEEKAILRELGFKNCVKLTDDGSWECAPEQDYSFGNSYIVFFPVSTVVYRISPDYEDTKGGQK